MAFKRIDETTYVECYSDECEEQEIKPPSDVWGFFTPPKGWITVKIDMWRYPGTIDRLYGAYNFYCSYDCFAEHMRQEVDKVSNV